MKLRLTKAEIEPGADGCKSPNCLICNLARDWLALRARLALAEAVADAMEALMAEQNGPPLLAPRHKAAWENAIVKAKAALAAWRKDEND